MHLKKLELSGFKSFAKKTILDFPKGITVVAGPNGSGKSNVVDAIRWALAEQSFKNLRGKKGEDLIFYGSSGRNSLARASVAMHFDFEGEHNHFGFSEAVVEREVDKSGENSYILNSRKVRLLDMEEFLAKSRVGSSSFRVISQGMSDKLLNLSPQEFKGFIEEAAGVKEYQDKKNQAVARLERTRENLEKVQAILAELRPQLKVLKREKDKLEKKGEYLSQLKNAARDFFGLRYRGILAWENKISEHKKKINSALKPLAGEVKKLKEDIFSFDKKDALDAEMSALTLEVRKLEGEENRTAREIISAEGRINLEEEKERQRLPVGAEYLKEKIGALAAKLSVDFKGMDVESLRSLMAGVAVALQDLLKVMEQGLDPVGGANTIPALKQSLEKLLTRQQEIKSRLAKATLARADKEKIFINERKVSLTKERVYRGKESELYRLESDLRQMEIEEEKLKLHQAKFHQDMAAVGAVTLADVIGEQAEAKAVLAGEPAVAEPVLEDKVWKLKKRLEEVGFIDEAVIQEYDGVNERYNFLYKESEDLTQTLDSLSNLVFGLEQQMATRYKTALSNMNHVFGGYFRLIFSGGKAELSSAKLANIKPSIADGEAKIDNQDKEETNGVELKLELPGKKVKSLATLSGGERTLTSIALLFALASIRKPPVMVLDEIDAALDETNTQKFVRLVKELSQDTQFIIITHNRETMRGADALYGVSMKDGISHLLSLKLQNV
ncbi:MAG: AAA family ATPase [Candidatus Sungbacteria bacterium]|uniref:AAA family ATPase n=1 Tax=Candidatus Sungiibacteriota bacterium TaxID=2750080 RepID=A0A932DSE4_9BACT|nr:AAA family ATPase [Candidatus Sungbacteria bacterium]MBI2466186.1 AAA family ATPase [Candidatus Sungbacteria bacterium]